MPKVIDRNQRRQEILDVTWNLILKGGLEAATMREIAKEAGFANGALKRYFESKDEIVEATYQRALKIVETYVAAALEDKTGLEALRRFCQAAMPLDEERITAGRVLLAFWELSLSKQPLFEAYHGHLKRWRESLHEYIRQGRQDGDILTEEPDEKLVDELVLLNAGANIMSLVGPEFSTVQLQHLHLEAFFTRITQPARA